MFRFPFIEWLDNYIKEIKSYGPAYCAWLIAVCLIMGIGLLMKYWIAVGIAGGLWIFGGLVLAYRGRDKDKEETE